MALLKPDIGQPAEVNAARIGTGFDLIDDHSDQIQELYSGVSQNALLINNLAGTVGGISAALNGLPVRISATETAIATLTGRVNADEGTILTYGSNIAGLNSDVGGLREQPRGPHDHRPDERPGRGRQPLGRHRGRLRPHRR